MTIEAGNTVWVSPYVGGEQEHIALHGQSITVGDNVLVSEADEYHITALGFLSGWTRRKKLIITLADSIETDYPFLLDNLDISNFTFEDARDFRITKCDPANTLLDYWIESSVPSLTANIWAKLHKAGSSILTGDSGTGNILDVNEGTVFVVGDYVVIKDDAHPDGEVNKITVINNNQLTFENNFAVNYTTAQNAKVCHAAYIYYKNPSASFASNGKNVWNLMFDDFLVEGFLDSTKWERFSNPTGAFTITVQDGYVRVLSANYYSYSQFGLKSINDTLIGGTYRLLMRVKSKQIATNYEQYNAIGQVLDTSNFNGLYVHHNTDFRLASRVGGVSSYANFEQSDFNWYRYIFKKLETSHHKGKQDDGTEHEIITNIYSGDAPFRILHWHDYYATTHETHMDYIAITDKYTFPEPSSFLGSEEEGESVTTIEKKYVALKSAKIYTNYEVAILRLANLGGITKTAFTELEYSVRGYVFESDSGTPITGHSVFLTGDKVSSVLTDENGLYVFPNLCIDENYEVSPDKYWYFSPQKYTYSPLGESKKLQNFIKGTTFYQTTHSAWTYFKRGADFGGPFPIPGEDYVQKVRLGATVTLTGVPELTPYELRFFNFELYDSYRGIRLGNLITDFVVGETKHEEVFYLDYVPAMTPYGFMVRTVVGSYWTDHAYYWDFHGEIEFLYEESAPSVETLPAIDITPTSAVLNGKLLEVGWEECTVWFEWGLTESYGNETTHESFSLKWYFSAAITGLVPSELYHFRAVVQSGGNTYYGADTVFTST